MSELDQLWEEVRRDPASDVAMEAFRARAVELAELERLAEACVDRGQALLAEDNSKGLSSLLEAAVLYGEDLNRPEEAVRWYQEVLARDPDHRQAWFALGLQLNHLQRWDELISMYRKRLADADDGEKATLHLYIAEVLDDRLEDPSAALAEVLLAIQRSPGNLRFLPRLEALAEKTGRWEDLALILAEAGLHQEDAELRAALAYRIAELYLGPLANRDRALVHLRSALVELDVDPMQVEDVEGATAFRDRFERLGERLDDAARDRRINPHPVRLERELARIYEFELGDHHRALGALTRALAHAPSDRELQDEVLRLGLVSSDLDRVARTFEGLVAETEHPLLRTFLRLRLGHLYGQALGRPERAAEVYEAILEDEPEHPEAQDRLQPLLDRLGRGETADAPTADDAEPELTTVQAWVDHVHALIDDEGDLRRAETACEQALQQHPEAEALLELLEETHRRQHHWEAVATVVRRRLKNASTPAMRLALRKTLARLFETQLDSKARALEVLAQAEQEGPFDLEVSRERERLHLERLDWVQVRQVLRDRIERASDRVVRARARATLARMAFELDGDLEGADAHLVQARQEAPDDPDIVQLSARVAERRGLTDMAVGLFEQLAEAGGPHGPRAWLRAGWLSMTPLQDDLRARRCFEAALAAHPDDPEASRGLFELAQRSRDHAAALMWAIRTAELTAQVTERADLLVRAATIAEEDLGDEPKAAELFEAALQLDPFRSALRARLGRLIAERDPIRAHRCYVAAASAEPDPEAAASWFEAAADLAEKAGLLDLALTGYRSALERQGQRAHALMAAARLLEQKADEERDAGQAAGLWNEVYELAATFLLSHEHTAATDDLAHVYLQMARAKAALGELEACARLARHAVQLRADVDALVLVVEMEERLGRFAFAASAARELARLRDDPEARVEDLVRCGDLYTQAGEHHRAAVVLEEAFALHPERRDLCERAASTRYRVDDASAAADLTRRHAETQEGPARSEALLRAAAWVRKTDRSRCRRLLREAFDAYPSVAAAQELSDLSEYDGELEEIPLIWRRAAQLSRRLGRWSDVALCLDRASHAAAFRLGDPRQLAEAAQGLAELDPSPRWPIVLARMLQRSDAGASTLEAHKAVLARVSGHVPSLIGIRDVYRGAERPAAAAILDQILDPEAGAPDGWAPEPWVLEPASEPIDEVLSVLGPAVLSTQKDVLRVKPPARRDRLGEAGVPYTVLEALNEAFDRVGRPMPPLYAREGALLQPAYLEEPVLVLDSAVLEEMDPIRLRAWAGHASAYLDLAPLTLALCDPWTLQAILRSVVEHGELSEARKRVRAVQKQLNAAQLEQLDGLVQTGALDRLDLAQARERHVARAAAAALVASGSRAHAVACAQAVHGADRARWEAHLVRFVSRPDVLAWLERAKLEQPAPA